MKIFLTNFLHQLQEIYKGFIIILYTNDIREKCKNFAYIQSKCTGLYLDTLNTYNVRVLLVTKIVFILYFSITGAALIAPILLYIITRRLIVFYPLHIPFTETNGPTELYITFFIEIMMDWIAFFAMYTVDLMFVHNFAMGISYMEIVKLDFDNINQMIAKHKDDLNDKKIGKLIGQAIQRGHKMRKYIYI